MSRRTHKELAVGSHLVSERERGRDGDKGKKKQKRKEKRQMSELETKARHTVGTQS